MKFPGQRSSINQDLIQNKSLEWAELFPFCLEITLSLIKLNTNIEIQTLAFGFEHMVLHFTRYCACPKCSLATITLRNIETLSLNV